MKVNEMECQTYVTWVVEVAMSVDWEVTDNNQQNDATGVVETGTVVDLKVSRMSINEVSDKIIELTWGEYASMMLARQEK